MSGHIEITVGDVNDVEARVVARYVGPPGEEQPGGDGPIVIRGTLKGPYCENAHTLPAQFAFREVRTSDEGVAEAVVPDPCTWSPDLPHVYHIDVEARRGEIVVATYRGQVGLRKATPT